MDLYGHPWSAPTREVRIVCAELGVPYSFVEMKRAEGEDYLPEALNPACKIPMIDDDGVVLAEAHAITRYLVSRHAPGGEWYPQELSRRAVTDQWLDWQALRLAPLAGTLLRERCIVRSPDDGAIARAEGFLGRILPELEMALGREPWLGGAAPSLADVAVFTSLDYLRLAGFDLSRFHAMLQWLQLFRDRESSAMTAHADLQAAWPAA